MAGETLLKSNIGTLKGVGKVRVELFRKLGIDTVEDLLYHFPRRYEDRGNIMKIAEIVPEESCSVLGTVTYPPVNIRSQRGVRLTRSLVKDGTGTLEIVWFNQPYITSKLALGKQYIFYGKAKKTSRMQMINPTIIQLEDMDKECVLVPVYPTVAGLTQAVIRQTIRQALDMLKDIEDPLPESVLRKYRLADFGESIRHVHYPKDMESLEKARRRCVFQELLEFQLALLSMRKQDNEAAGIMFNKSTLTDSFIKSLPFELTDAQHRVFNEIYTDMTLPKTMNRLVQGDVGSGKTVVAVLAMLVAAESGYQSAMMAPTEILAQQHFNTVSRLLEGFPFRVALLTGSTTAKNAKEILSGLANGDIHIIIGTHALIEERVQYHNLGLVITDEQHRFGVKQRALLSRKGNNPDMLVMTATPIPRTLAMILYGDLDISIIDEMPPGRIKVKTYVVTEDYRERIDRFILKEVGEGRQVYIICPLVEDSEMIDAYSAVKTAEEAAAKFKDCRVGIIHGKMKPAEKEEVMKSFAEGSIDILVSTTVVEVGVDVPNASLMVVENAERFGLAQLHQLRGRVGRGKNQSYCILFNQGSSEVSKERLEIMTKSTDGFYISEQDLKLRGPGEFFGTRQHGLPELKIANLYTDMNILKEAQECSERIYRYGYLEKEEYSRLKDRVYHFYNLNFGGLL
ncbi:MAG: ATP-dependent DNA helicase RecG [Clostridiaceae bacterium]|nr:ATP-dependent DNA helicase RecG [Clostridiaceae bacterium]